MNQESLSEEEIEDILSDAGVRVDYDIYNLKWRFEACFDCLRIPRVTGEYYSNYLDALEEGLAFAEDYRS